MPCLMGDISPHQPVHLQALNVAAMTLPLGKDNWTYGNRFNGKANGQQR
jgi:hypothetical protein